MDKYGEFYGRDRISELLGMDKAALDFSDAREKKKPKKDSSLSAVWVLPLPNGSRPKGEEINTILNLIMPRLPFPQSLGE